MLTREEARAKVVPVCRRLCRRRSDVRAVVHAHPRTATGPAVAGEAMLAPVLPELILLTGPAPTMGPTLTVDHHRMECVEHAARIPLAARAPGAARELPADEVAPLCVRRADGRSAAS